MEAFFPPSPDYIRAFEQLTDYLRILKGAYRLAGFLLRETLGQNQQAAVISYGQVKDVTGLSTPTARDYFELLDQLKIFPSRVLGGTGQQERLVLVGTPASLQLLARYDVRELSAFELLELARQGGPCKKFTVPPVKNFQGEKNISDPCKNFSGSRALDPDRDLDPDLNPDRDPDQNLDPNPDPGSQTAGEAARATVGDLEIVASPQQLSFLAHFFKSVSVAMTDWIRKSPKAALELEGPAQILDFPQPAPADLTPAGEPAVIPPVVPAAPVETAPAVETFPPAAAAPAQPDPPRAEVQPPPEDLQPRPDDPWFERSPAAGVPPGWTASQWSTYVRNRAELRRHADPDREAKEKAIAERDAEFQKLERRQQDRVSKLSATEKRRLVDLQEKPIGELVRGFHAQYIKARDPEKEEIGLRIWIRELELFAAETPRILLLLEQAFIGASGSGWSYRSAQINLVNLARQAQLECPAHWGSKSGRRAS